MIKMAYFARSLTKKSAANAKNLQLFQLRAKGGRDADRSCPNLL